VRSISRARLDVAEQLRFVQAMPEVDVVLAEQLGVARLEVGEKRGVSLAVTWLAFWGLGCRKRARCRGAGVRPLASTLGDSFNDRRGV